MLKINHDDIIITIDDNTISTNHGISRTIDETITMADLVNIFDQMLAIDNEIIRLDGICAKATVKPVDKSNKLNFRKHLTDLSTTFSNMLMFVMINPNKKGIKYEQGTI